MIMIFGTLVFNDISRYFFHFLEIFIFQVVRREGGGGGVKGKKLPKMTKIMSAALHISGIIHHMILINGTHVYKDNIYRCFFTFSQILIFRVNSGVKEQKMA